MHIFPLFRLRNLISRAFFRLAIAPFLGSCGKGSAIVRAAGVEGAGNIHLGDNVFVAEGAVLAAVRLTEADRPRLSIGDRCNLGRNNHIYATAGITLEPGVLTAGNVYIGDNTHSFESIDLAVRDQPVRQLAEVTIGAGSWLGQNVCIIGASVGKGCVIGANSVVLSDVPDYCVAVGTPARIVRRLDPATGQWNKP
jgi:acetyltransferase-like isoleucine patch superfamily enzyme